MRTSRMAFVAILLSAVSVFAQQPAGEATPRNVILVGWDGAQRAHVQECLARGELPALKALADEGGLVDIDVVNGATDTKAGWTQILTGYSPEITGVYSNGRFRDVPAGLSVFERLKARFGPERFACLAVIGKSAHCGEIRAPFKKPLPADADTTGPTAAAAPKKPAQPGAGRRNYQRTVEEDGVRYAVFDGSPYHTMHKSCDVWEYGLSLDAKVGARALELLEQYREKPFFFFVHFAEVDHSGHRHGENSKEYNDALVSNDRWTGKLVAKLKELGLYDRTVIYVTADHGFDEDATRHSYAPFVFLGTNDPQVRRDGMRQDVAPTILARYGLDLAAIDPPPDGEPLTAPPSKPVLKAPEEKPRGAPAQGARKRNPARRKKDAAPAVP